MKKRYCFLVMFSVFLFTSCSSQETQPESVIVKTETTPANPVHTDTLSEKETTNNKNNEKEQYIEFALPDGKVKINLDGVKILKQYLEAVPDKQSVTDKMKLTQLDIPNKETVYLLQFSCSNELCSYLLLNQEGNGESQLLADLAQLRSTAVSPDNEKIMFLFDRITKQTGSALLQTKLMVLSLKNLELLTMQEGDTPFERDFNRPVAAASWQDNDTVQAVVPVVKKSDAADIKNPAKSEDDTETTETLVLTMSPDK